MRRVITGNLRVGKSCTMGMTTESWLRNSKKTRNLATAEVARDGGRYAVQGHLRSLKVTQGH